MLSKKQKLTKKDFRFFKKRGKSAHSPHFTLVVYETSQKKQSRFSFVVSKKISKKSTARNKLKRLGYQTIRYLYPDIKKGASFVFFFKNGAENLNKETILKEITSVLKIANALL